MTGFGSPCGACKFLRRKCTRGCVFAPYFCHEQGAAHFAAIHKVFGASNVSKLLAHLPVTDRCEAAVTISYEAQARVQDPIYGCVAHIFALQQQVVNLQAQLASLKAQASQNLINSTTASSTQEEDKLYAKFPPYQQDGHGLFNLANPTMAQPFDLNPLSSVETMLSHGNELLGQHFMGGNYQNSAMDEAHLSFTNCDPFSDTSYSDMQMSTARTPTFQDVEDLESIAFAYLHST